MLNFLVPKEYTLKNSEKAVLKFERLPLVITENMKEQDDTKRLIV